MVVALLVVHVSVVSCPATTVTGLADSETVGGADGGLGGTGGGPGGFGGGTGGEGGIGGTCGFPPVPTELVCGANAEPAPPHPAQKRPKRIVARTKDS